MYDRKVRRLLPLWVQPVAGGSPHRIGTILGAEMPGLVADGTSIIYGNGHDIYSVSRDGSSSRKLLTVDSRSFWFPIFAGRADLSIHPV